MATGFAASATWARGMSPQTGIPNAWRLPQYSGRGNERAHPQARADRWEPRRLRRAGSWRDCRPHLHGAYRAGGPPLDVGERPQRPHTPRGARLRADARGRDGGVREKLAAGVADDKP